MLKKILLIFILTIFSTPSYALIWIEPYLLFNLIGYGSEITESSKIREYEYNTLLYGGRAGISMFNFQFGGDYSQGINVVRTELEGAISTNKYEKEDIGAFIGYRFDTYRVYYTQIFSTSLTQKGGDNRLIHKGRGQAIGFGNIYDDTFALNIEYKRLKFTDVEQITGTPIGSRAKANPLSINEISVGISWIIDIFGGGKTSKAPAKQ